MRIVTETSLRYFDFWSGAKDTAECLTLGQLDTIEAILEECYPEGMTDTQINDFFWFEKDTIAEWLGFSSWESLLNGDEEEDEEEE